MLILSKNILKKKNELEFYDHYKDLFYLTLKNLDVKSLQKFSRILEKKIIQKKHIFVAGNGGSAAISNHFLCDFNKGIKISSKRQLKPKVISLVNSLELITAISNDINYDEIFSYQLENFANKKDLLITFSCSGNSKNILNAIKTAKKLKLNIIHICGFGKKNEYVDLDINLNCKNYGITEDMFSYIMHSTSQFIRSKYQKNNIL